MEKKSDYKKGRVAKCAPKKNHIAIPKKGLADVVFCVRIKLS